MVIVTGHWKSRLVSRRRRGFFLEPSINTWERNHFLCFIHEAQRTNNNIIMMLPSHHDQFTLELRLSQVELREITETLHCVAFH